PESAPRHSHVHDVDTSLILQTIDSSVWHRHGHRRGLCVSFILIRPPPRPTLFPYTTLFRSWTTPSSSSSPRSSSTPRRPTRTPRDRKSTRLNSSHVSSSYAVFCLKKKMHSHFLLANSCRVSACFSGSARSGTCN